MNETGKAQRVSCLIAKPSNTSVVICCAGMGTRLGIGTTKALVNISNKPLIIRQLELLNDFDDIRIVVGFDAERVINAVRSYRNDIMFVFNYDYEHNGPADSLRKGLLTARTYTLMMDGDTVNEPKSFNDFLATEGESIAINTVASSETVKAQVKDGKVIKLSKNEGNAQWSGLARIKSESLKGKSPHTYEMLNPLLPITAMEVKLREINTQEDYEKAVSWYESGMN